jgi:hypothetical protein
VTAPPKISLSSHGILAAAPASAHQALNEKMEIEEAEGCTFQQASPSKLKVEAPCGYLNGTYSYTIKDPSPEKEIVVRFSANRPTLKSHTLLIERPLILPKQK